MRAFSLAICLGAISMAWPAFAAAQVFAGGQSGAPGGQPGTSGGLPGGTGGQSGGSGVQSGFAGGGQSGSASAATTSDITKKALSKAEWKDDSKIDEGLAGLLEQALKNNPDIRVAEMKLQQAEAELNRARMTAIHKIVVLQSQLRSARAELAEAEKSYKRMKDLSDAHAISAAELAQAALAVMSAKEKVTRSEAEFPYLIGKTPLTATWTFDRDTGKALYRSAIVAAPGMAASGAASAARADFYISSIRNVSHAQTDKLRPLLQASAKWPNRKPADLRHVVDDHLRAFLPGFAFEIMTTGDAKGPRGCLVPRSRKSCRSMRWCSGSKIGTR